MFLNAEQVEKLDAELHEFCLLLSPYFEMKIAEKALEILMSKYELHLYNVDSLLACTLPFHDTPQFTR